MRKPPLPDRVITRVEAHRNGATFFYTGKPCRKGHLALRYVSNGMCYGCMNAYKSEGVRNPYDDRLVPFVPTGLWRPGTWNASTVKVCEDALQKFVEDWIAGNAPLPILPATKFLKIYGERMVKLKDVTDEAGTTYEIYTTRTGNQRMQMSVATSGAPGAALVDLFTVDALRCPEWVFVDCGKGERWHACENINYALFEVISPEALSASIQYFGMRGDL